MNCERAIELLPWYLNGTLDEGERGAVREHLKDCESCRRALEDTGMAWRAFAQHVPAEALVALAWGETPEGHDPDVLERHLQSCPECAAELEMARTSRRLEEDDRIALFPASRTRSLERSARPGAWRAAALAAGLAGIVAASGWLWSAGRVHTLEERLAQASPPTAAAPAPAPPAPAPAAADRDRVAALASEVERLRASQAELLDQESRMREQLTQIAEARPAEPAPQINAWISDLRPSGDVVRGGPGEVAELPAGTAAGLMLQASHPETHTSHRIEIVDAAGKVVWSADGLRRSPQDDFSLILPGTLKPGAYTIRLSAREGGKRVDLESYAIRVK
jgi:putative zinc finger protein